MRLICPNCGAQYEVDASVIPDGGRDVQCSGCGHNWFQSGPDAAQPLPPDESPEAWDVSSDDSDLIGWSEADDAPAQDEAAEAEAPAEDVTEADEPPPAAEAGPEEDLSSVLAAMIADQPDSLAASVPGDYFEDSDYDDTLTPAPAAGTTPRKPVDDSMLAILREEAEREAAHRRAEGLSEMQSQPELGLEEASRKPDPAPEDEEIFFDLDDEAAPDAPKGRERLPDVEEINSTLASASDRSTLSTPFGVQPDTGSAGGFRGGFVSVVLIAAIAAATYAFAPRLVQMAPALEAPLTAYVKAVDTGRIKLDQSMQNILENLAKTE